ncbi:MAG TPA: hypothetical protein VFA70_15705 [Dehalococcoidia bacterium]|nr:hypothetical protein [Dehalococcoidia bacterium]
MTDQDTITVSRALLQGALEQSFRFGAIEDASSLRGDATAIAHRAAVWAAETAQRMEIDAGLAAAHQQPDVRGSLSEVPNPLRSLLYTAWQMGWTEAQAHPDMGRIHAVDMAWAWVRQHAPALEARLLAAPAEEPQP